MLITIFNTAQNFWKVYPELRTFFPALSINDDGSDAKHPTSLYMWGLALVLCPSSPYSNLTLKERVVRVEQDLGITINLEEDEVAQDFKNLVLSKKEKFLIGWEQKMEERQEFIDSLPYDQNTYELLDKMMKGTQAMWKQYMDCLKDVQDERQQNFGGAQESLFEKSA